MIIKKSDKGNKKKYKWNLYNKQKTFLIIKNKKYKIKIIYLDLK